jgi:hypothetical protein
MKRRERSSDVWKGTHILSNEVLFNQARLNKFALNASFIGNDSNRGGRCGETFTRRKTYVAQDIRYGFEQGDTKCVALTDSTLPSSGISNGSKESQREKGGKDVHLDCCQRNCL